ncbi:hypothetical protein HBI95_012490 [Parastagonospora nodorum]|nr:hypothetical protein HBI95_012490 [Parastagonospora nodorum]KAH4311619.1 hypothetical protein HBI01_011430 [Parastagonospora nodorum]KAH4328260.1 hypothetical protein HBI00_110850 [Parastagonospora nodorum]KAH4533849.1 hypothetical protein HBH87_012930 [Parastagonospora nodorum]KAH4941804.1 hypothetical protein HBH74_061260 [Parastagonospora nodorum]
MILFTTAFLAWVASASGQSISTGTSASRTSIVNITAWWCARLGLSNDNNCKISEEVVFGIRREDYWSLQAESGGIISAKTPNSSVFVPDANRLFPFKTNGTGPLTAGIGRFVMGITVDYFSFNGTPNFAQLLKDT